MFVSGVCMMVFTRITSMKRGYGMIFMSITTFKITFSMKSDYREFWGMG